MHTNREEDARNPKKKKNANVGQWFWGFIKYASFISVFTTIQVGFRPTEQMYRYNAVMSRAQSKQQRVTCTFRTDKRHLRARFYFIAHK
jgi:hypothetical protein